MTSSSDAVVALATLLTLVAASVDAQPRYRVVSTVGATAEAHDVLALGSRVFVATSGGLVVREGTSVRVLGVREGLPGARARSVSHVDGALYVGTLEGLAELDATTLDVKRTFAIRRVRRVLDFGGARYAVGYEGLRRLDAPTRAIALGSSHARERLTDALVVRGERGDELWIASAGAGVLRVSADARVIGRLTAGSGLPDDTVHALAHHGDDVLVGTFGGLAVIRGGRVVRGHALSRASERLPLRDVRAIAAHDGEVFVATFGAGLHRLSGSARAYEGAREAFALASSEAGLLVAHREGTAVLGGGRSDATRLVALADRSLPSADVTALARAFGALYVGTFDRGLVRLHDDGRVESLATQLARWHVDGRVNDLAVTTRGGERLWIATDRGLFWHDGRRFVPVDHARGPGRTHVTSLHVDPRGALWVTSSRVLARWSGGEQSSAVDPADPENWQGWGSDALSVTLATGGGDVERFPVQQLHAVHVIADARDTTRDEVWVGSLHGLYRFDPRTARLHRHTVSSGALPVDWVTALATIDGALVAGTYHGGLSWKRGDRFAHETERDGLPAGWVNPHAIVAHGGALHVGTLERGLLVGTRGAWRHYTTRDGLPSDDVTAILPEGDGIWVGTRGGLVWMERAR